MLPLPDVSVDDSEIETFADWLELSALVSGVVSKAAVWDALGEELAVGGSVEDLGGKADLYKADYLLARRDILQQFTDDLWRSLQLRQRVLGSGFPLRIDPESVFRRGGSWSDHLGYTALLIADLGWYYPGVKGLVGSVSEFSHILEKLAEASIKTRLRGVAYRFGASPYEPGQPTGIVARVRHLGTIFKLQYVEENTVLRAGEKDRGLDVICRLSFGDDGPGTLFLLVQCATGKNWTKKKGEPSTEDWRPLFQWDSTLVRAVAIPRRLKNPSAEYARFWRHFDGAVILDRMRLCGDNFEPSIDAAMRNRILSWCRNRLKEIGRGTIPS